MTDALTVCGIPLVDNDGEPFDIPDGTPVAALAVIEVITTDGKQALLLAHTDGVTAWAGLGMLRAGVLAQEIDLQDAWEDYDDE